MNKKKRRFRFGVVCLAALAGIGLLAGAVSTEEQAVVEEVKPVVVVDTARPTRGGLAVAGEFIATVEPSQQMTIYPKTTAEVLAVNFSIGDTVEAGDILFEMDSQPLRTSIAQSQAAVASAKAKAEYNLAQAEKDYETYQYNLESGNNANLVSSESTVLNAEAAVRSAENAQQTATANLASAKRNLRDHRDKDEWDYGGDKATYDQIHDQLRDAVVQAEIAVEGARIGVENAKSALEQAQKARDTTQTLADEQVTSVQDAVEYARLNTDFSDQYIAIQKLQNDLKNFVGVAAISGVVEQRNIDPYDMASPQTPAFVISRKDAMTVTFQVAESVVAGLEPGDAILVDKQGETWPGTVYEISTMVNVQGGLYTVKASVENAPFPMNSGSTIKVIADTKKAEDALLVPVNAVYFRDGEAYAYVYEGTAVRRVTVETGISDNESIQILSGLTAADDVVVTWNANLRDGLEVVHTSEVEAKMAQEARAAVEATEPPETAEAAEAPATPEGGEVVS